MFITVGAMGASMKITSKESFHQFFLDFSYLDNNQNN
jgi:hypothetical protein